MSIRRAVAAAAVLVLAVTGCNTLPQTRPGPAQSASTSLPADPTVVLAAATAAELAIATSQALFERAPVVALAGEHDPDSQQAAAGLAPAGVPLLLVPDGEAGTAALTTELDRLDPVALVPFGGGASSFAEAAYAGADQIQVLAPDRALPDIAPAPPLASLLVLALGTDHDRAASHTAHASGARVVTLPHPDPRADPTSIQALAGQPVEHLLALGEEFGPARQLRHRVEVASTGIQLPGGGALIYPGRRMVAIYGHPGDPNLGVLGEQPLPAAIARARQTAAQYDDLFDEPVVPTFEIITTVASSQPGPSGDYSLATPVERLRPWVDAAAEAGVYVVLDLQPGRTDFLTQAKWYEELLREPHVGLALDPEWRLAPHQVHLEQIGTVHATEVNQVAEWLAGLTRTHRLPQKLLVLHQFRQAMIGDRVQVDTHHDELAMLVHADGHGTPAQKLDTWQALQVNAPEGLWWGWKNFYDEDQPTLTPAQTAEVRPMPRFISYQ